jgi:hypothetical protein
LHKVYFNKKDSFNRLCFAFFDGILASLGQVTHPDGSPNYLEIYSSRSTFMNLFDITNDLFLLSTEQLTGEKIENYTQLWLTTDLPQQVGWNNIKFDDIRKE